jgi:3-deoxy-D-manno-octulosonate 8-phosphate phosphatase (KDO 8-P phosphatase)
MVDLTLFANIRLLISDVDGVLTAGDIIISDSGAETKIFHVHDGFAIQLLLQQGIEFAAISARSTPTVQLRMEKLGVTHFYQGNKNKLPAFLALLEQLSLQPQQVAYIGDDWVDLPLLNRVGLPIAVANAVSEVKAKARYITACRGGSGAVREVIMHLLQAQGLYDTALAKYDK